MGQLTPSGRLIAVDGDTVYGYGRKSEFLSEAIVLEYQLYAAARSSNFQAMWHIIQNQGKSSNGFDPAFLNYAGDWKLRQGIPLADQTAVSFIWKLDKPDLQARAMVVAGNSLFVAGPPDVVDEEDAFFALDNADVLEMLAEQSALLEGKDGARLWAVSAATGEKLAEYRLDSLPVWDGLVAAGGNLYLTTMNGETLCYAGFTRGLRQRPKAPDRRGIHRQDEAVPSKSISAPAQSTY